MTPRAANAGVVSTRRERTRTMSNHTPIQLPLAIDGMTIEIPLTRGKTTLVSACDCDLTAFRWCLTTGNKGNEYAIRRLRHEIQRLHRVVMERMLGRPLHAKEFVDHINGESLDNRRANLRLATQTQNNINAKCRSDNQSGFKGVGFHRQTGKWVARIKVNGRTKSLGLYETPEEAHQAYCKAAIQYYGEFARFE